MITTQQRRAPAGNSTFAIGGVSCSADSLVVAESSVLRINICAENPAHRKSAKRYRQVNEKTIKRKPTDNKNIYSLRKFFIL
jgi:hypothetical protein